MHSSSQRHDDSSPSPSSSIETRSSPSLEWAPAQLSKSSSPTRVPKELLELAKQLELVDHQRQQLLQKPQTGLPVSPVYQRRPQSPVTPILAPLPSPVLLSKTKPSLGLAPSISLSNVVICDLCGAELASGTLMRAHKASSCPMRVVTCPRAGCNASFLAHERAAHDDNDCKATRRTNQLLEDHRVAHSLAPCDLCNEPVENRQMNDHKLFACVKRIVLCQFEAFGCRDRFPADQRVAHEANDCRVAKHRARIRTDAASVNEQTTCDWCNQQVLKRRLLDHQEDECPRRERPCPNAINGCPEWVPVEDFDHHVKTQCVVTLERDAMAARAREMNALVVCSECGAYVKRRHLMGHANAECVSRIVRCKNAAHGCRARLRWRDRHLHEDFMALANRERSMLQFPVGGDAYVVLNSETRAQLDKRPVDLAPPWTVELFLWVVEAKDEILDLHAKSLAFVETAVAKQRELERFQQQAKACKKKLRELKNLKKSDKDKRSNSQLLGDVSLAAKTLADEFNAADSGILESSQAIALARGHIQILVTDAHRLLKDEVKRDAVVGGEIKSSVEAQATERMATSELLSAEFLSDDELLRLGDLDRWATAIAPQSADRVATAERQQKAQEQRKLLNKRAELTASVNELQQQEEDGSLSEQEVTRLRRRYERELAKLEAKLALVSDNTPTVLLERKGRHVALSSTKNAIVLAGASSGRVTFVRSGPKRGEVNFPVTLTRSRWHHLVFCASKSELTLVLDGEAKAVKRGTFELPLARLGSNEPGESFQGCVQEVRVWSSCLTAEYLRVHAGEIVDVEKNKADLTAYYTFEEGAGDVVDDMALKQPRAACFGTQWTLYNSAAIRRKFGLPPTPSLRDKTSCVVNQRLKLLAQRARDREIEPLTCRQNCGAKLVLRELEIHMRVECENRMVVCREVGCEQTFRCCERARHLATECERATYREALVRQYHERETLEPCLLGCGERVKRRHTERHYLRQCPNRLVPCPQADCGESIVAKGLASHLEVDCKSWELVAERKMVENARKRQQDKQEKSRVQHDGAHD